MCAMLLYATFPLIDGIGRGPGNGVTDCSVGSSEQDCGVPLRGMWTSFEFTPFSYLQSCIYETSTVLGGESALSSQNRLIEE